jgi:hypothetical protein
VIDAFGELEWLIISQSSGSERVVCEEAEFLEDD